MKKAWLLIVALVLSTILAACGGNTQSTDKASEGQAPKDKKLVVYTNSASEGRGDWLKQKAAEASCEIENPEFKGKYHVPANLGGGTNRAVVYGMLMRQLDPNGDLGVSDKGWNEIKTFFDNGYKTPEGEDAMANLASGKVPIAFTFSSG